MPIGVTIGGLVRGEEGMLVSGNTQIEPGDSVMVFCHNINMKKLRNTSSKREGDRDILHI